MNQYINYIISGAGQLNNVCAIKSIEHNGNQPERQVIEFIFPNKMHILSYALPVNIFSELSEKWFFLDEMQIWINIQPALQIINSLKQIVKEINW